MSSKRRSVGAVAAGLATIMVVSNGTDTVLELTGAFPSLAEQQASGFDTPWMLAAALGYRALVWFTAVVLLVTPLCVWAGGRIQRTSPRPAGAGPLARVRS